MIRNAIIAIFVVFFFTTCTRHVPNVPILIDMNGFENVPNSSYFKEVLEQRLRKYGFEITTDTRAPYYLKVFKFYNYNYTFRESAPSDDCSYSDYVLKAYEYGLEVELLDRDRVVINKWESSRSKEDDIVEKEAYSDCTEYKVREPILQDGAFFRQKAIDIAKKSANIVAKEY
jgi:hypothetical protein